MRNLTKSSQAKLPTEYGEFLITIYRSTDDNLEHVTLVCGDVSSGSVLTRVHSKCLTGDTFLSLRCDCHQQLDISMKLIQAKGQGIIIYLDQEGRGIGLANKIEAYKLQEAGNDTFEANELLGLPADPRDYQVAADMLKDIGVTSIELLTDGYGKQEQLRKYGIEVTKVTRFHDLANDTNRDYLAAKRRRAERHRAKS